MINATSGFAELLNPAIDRIYLDTRRERPLEFKEVLNVSNHIRQNEQDQEFAGLGVMPSKPEGQQFTLDQPIAGGTVTYTAVPFGLAMEVTFEMWHQDLFGVMGQMAQELARSSRNRMEVNAATIFNSAFDTAVTGFDGDELCSTSHATPGGQSIANRPAVDIGLSITGIQDGIQAFETLVNGRGLPMLLSPSIIMIDPANRFVAREILGSSSRPFTANNEINSLVDDDLKIFVYHYLTTSTNWFLLANKDQHDLHFKWMNTPIFDSFDDPRSKNAVFTVYQNHSDGFGSWRGVYGSTG